MKTYPIPDATGLAPQAARILQTHPVRKSRVQKEAFRTDVVTILQELGWPVKVETSGRLLKSHNVVAGNPDAAKLVLTAHYDTPARLPFPNFIAPRNLPLTFAVQLVLALLILTPTFFGSFGARMAGLPPLAAMCVGFALMGLAMWLLLAGPANPTNANDNTSGILTLLETAAALPKSAQQHVAIVFFDNEELGLVGSSIFRGRHGTLPKALLLNFDCVGDGDTVMFIPSATVRRNKNTLAALESAFTPRSQKRAFINKFPLALYPSDQIGFVQGVGVAAMRRLPLVGYYVSRLHTARDTVLEAENLLFLRGGVLRLVAELVAESDE